MAQKGFFKKDGTKGDKTKKKRTEKTWMTPPEPFYMEDGYIKRRDEDDKEFTIGKSLENVIGTIFLMFTRMKFYHNGEECFYIDKKLFDWIRPTKVRVRFKDKNDNATYHDISFSVVVENAEIVSPFKNQGKQLSVPIRFFTK